MDGNDVLDVGPTNAGGRRSVPDIALEALDRLGFPFSERLDTSIGQIAHPAVHAFPSRRRLNEVAEADALHAATDEIPARNSQRAGMIACVILR